MASQVQVQQSRTFGFPGVAQIGASASMPIDLDDDTGMSACMPIVIDDDDDDIVTAPSVSSVPASSQSPRRKARRIPSAPPRPYDHDTQLRKETKTRRYSWMTDSQPQEANDEADQRPAKRQKLTDEERVVRRREQKNESQRRCRAAVKGQEGQGRHTAVGPAPPATPPAVENHAVIDNHNSMTTSEDPAEQNAETTLPASPDDPEPADDLETQMRAAFDPPDAEIPYDYHVMAWDVDDDTPEEQSNILWHDPNDGLLVEVNVDEYMAERRRQLDDKLPLELELELFGSL